METRNRLLTRPTGSITFVAAAAVALAVAMLAVLLAVTLLHNLHASVSVPKTYVAAREQAPDAVDRNDIYAAALAARANGQSADSQDRNTLLNYREVLARFNDPSPDAQERNIQLSER